MMDSGIKWVGDVHKKYSIRKLKYGCEILDEFRKPVTAHLRSQDSEILYDYYGASGAIDKIDGYTIDDDILLIGEDGANLRVRNLPLVYQVHGKAWINNHAHIVKPIKGILDYTYTYFMLESLDINPYITGSAQPKFNQESLRNMHIIIPPIDEQKRIANFLDEKCEQIDSLTADIQSQIDTLEEYKKSVITEAVTKGLNPDVEMKDSEIEWIGQIPSNWNILKIKNIITKDSFGIKIGPFGSALTNKTKGDGEYNVYGQANLISNDFSKTKHTVSKDVFTSLMAYEVFPNDICLSMMGTIGKCKTVPQNITQGIMDSHLIKIRLSPIVLSKFFEYAYDKDLGGICFTQMQYDKKGFIMDGLNTTIVKNLKLPVPPIQEQKEILHYLDAKCAEIDAIISEKKEQLSTLAEYKKSLIYEYVTGKKEVAAA